MIRIVTDSASDLDKNVAEELGVICVPLTVSFGTEHLKDGVELGKKEFYERLISDVRHPQTSQVTPYALEQVFQQAKTAGDDLVVILLSSRLSGTYQSGLIAERSTYGEEEDTNSGNPHRKSCYVIDSRMASAGQQILVEYASNLRKQGKTAREIARSVRALRPRVRLFACVNTLEYLCRGGRISKVAAAIGTMINVKPILFVKENGQPEIIARMRGNQKAIAYILEQIKKDPPDEGFPIYIMYSFAEEGAMRLRKAIRMAGYRVQMKHVVHVGAVIGSHIGPNAYGVAYVSRQEK